jgi:hypothetical protein
LSAAPTFAFAVADFTAAIFVNNLLNFSSASAILSLRETVPFNALVRSDATFMTSVSGVTCGFIIYWCLKNTVSLILFALVFHNVDVEALVILHCHPNVETGVRVNVPGLSVLGLEVGHHRASQRCKWVFHVMVLPVDMGICGHFWCNVALSKEVDGEFRWSHKLAPQGEGNVSLTLLRMETK